MTVQYPRKGMTGNSQNPRCSGNAQAERVQAVLPDGATRMGGFFIGMVSPSSLVVIDEVNVVHVASFKPEGDPPIASNRNTPPSSSIPSEWVQSVSRQIEIARLASGIQVCQGKSDSFHLVCGYPAGVVSHIEPPQPSMAKRTDHGLIIPCAGTVINGSANL